ncbi:MAG: hypothetical protein ACJ739_14670, partial [Acidimicrobiales bacterium]
MSLTTTIGRRSALAVGIALAAALCLTSPAGAERPPKLLVTGGEEWFTHPLGWYEVVRGPADVQVGKQGFSGRLTATVQPDDRAMPVAGECERGMVSLYVEGDDALLELTGVGDVCAHH